MTTLVILEGARESLESLPRPPPDFNAVVTPHVDQACEILQRAITSAAEVRDGSIHFPGFYIFVPSIVIHTCLNDHDAGRRGERDCFGGAHLRVLGAAVVQAKNIGEPWRVRLGCRRLLAELGETPR